VEQKTKGGPFIKTLTHLLMVVVAAGLMLAFASTAVAQEKAKAEKAKTAPAKETKAQGGNVLFENERVRVTESRIKPGENNGMKMRSDRVNVSINPGKTRVHYPDGKKVDFDLKAGSVRFNKAGTSSTENIGKTETRTVIVNLK
jgi:hypothetical protein